jgi:hypothetical protein
VQHRCNLRSHAPIFGAIKDILESWPIGKNPPLQMDNRWAWEKVESAGSTNQINWSATSATFNSPNGDKYRLSAEARRPVY